VPLSLSQGAGRRTPVELPPDNLWCYIALIRDYADPFLFRRAYHHAAGSSHNGVMLLGMLR
jgi:hypothetical protein